MDVMRANSSAAAGRHMSSTCWGETVVHVESNLSWSRFCLLSDSLNHLQSTIWDPGLSWVSRRLETMSEMTGERTLSSALLSAFFSMCSRNSALFLGQRPWVQPNCLAWKQHQLLACFYSLLSAARLSVNAAQIQSLVSSFIQRCPKWSSQQLHTL